MCHELKLTIEARVGTRDLSFPVEGLICAGCVGRDRVSLQDHIDELGRLGVALPTRTSIVPVLPHYQ